MTHILIVDDEPDLVGILEYLFKNEGYHVLTAYTGEEALKLVHSMKPQLVILDIMLPGLDGFAVCRYIKKNTSIPVVILTAKKEDEDKIRGLELGADDYLTKPFHNKELILRVHKILKQVPAKRQKEKIQIGDIKINLITREVYLKTKKIDLTPIEFNLLCFLASQPRKVIKWQILFEELWGYKDWEGNKEIVKIAIYRLRQKIERNPSCPDYLLTVRGIGYRISDPSKK